jgi:serine/threonine protein kinase
VKPLKFKTWGIENWWKMEMKWVLLQMMHQLALRLKDFHALGYVHRDLKPANVMWLPRENRWTVIDFGCAARTGEDARLGFSLAYAAPEVIAAYRRGDVTMVAQVRFLSCCCGALFSIGNVPFCHLASDISTLLTAPFKWMSKYAHSLIHAGIYRHGVMLSSWSSASHLMEGKEAKMCSND